LPQDIAVRWNREVNRILQLPDMKERMVSLGLEAAGGSPERLREHVKREIAKWQNVVRLANIKVDG
jgi:tripartite-type tricarboxylate transporter receptor subunit TctC